MGKYKLCSFLLIALFVSTSQVLGGYGRPLPIQTISVTEEGAIYPRANFSTTVQVAAGRTLSRMDINGLSAMLQQYVGWPADPTSVQSISMMISQWGERHGVFFDIVAPPTVGTRLSLKLFPKSTGPSLLTFQNLDITDRPPLPSVAVSSWTSLAPSYAPPVLAYPPPGVVVGTPTLMAPSPMQQPVAAAPQQQPPSTMAQPAIPQQPTVMATPAVAPQPSSAAVAQSPQPAPAPSQPQANGWHYQLNQSQPLPSSNQPSVKPDETPNHPVVVNTTPGGANLTDTPFSMVPTAGLDQLQSAYSRLVEKCHTLENLVAQLQSELSTRKFEQGRVDELEAQQRTLTQTIQSIQSELDRTQNALIKSQDDFHLMQEDRNRMAALALNDERQNKQRNDGENVYNTYNKLQQTQARLQAVESERDQLMAQVQELQANNAGSGSLQQQLQQVQAERDQLQNVLVTMKSNSSYDAQRIQRLEQDKAHLQSALTAANLRLTSRGEAPQLASVESKMNELANKEQDLNQRLQDTQSDQERIRQLESESNELHNMLDQLTQQPSPVNSTATAVAALANPVPPEIQTLQQTEAQASAVQQKAQQTLNEAKSESEAFAKSLGKGAVVPVRVIVIKTRFVPVASDAQGTIVDIPKLSAAGTEKIREAAQALIGKPFDLTSAANLGRMMGTVLKEEGLNDYDVVLPVQDLSSGMMTIEVKKP